MSNNKDYWNFMLGVKLIMPISEKIMPSILDKEIDSTEADAFGHRHFAKALQDIIESPSNRPPFTLGLLGKWGVGKSSIKTLYLSSFNELDGNVRKQKVFPITFNAWRYGGENIKRALLRHVYLSLGGDDTLLSDDSVQTNPTCSYGEKNMEKSNT